MESAAKCNDYAKSSNSSSSSHGASLKSKHSLHDRQTVQEKYISEWNDLSHLSEDPYLKQLRHLAINGGLKVSKFRSVCWALLLGVLSGRSQSWATQRRCDRNRYVELIRQFYINPRMAAEDDPLSQSDKSVWNQHFCDKELCTVIRQDVIRTFPGVEFFRKSTIQDIMTNILFCYARVNPEMCYRQGMHEILAPIIFIMHCDHQALLHIQDVSGHDVDSILKEVLDPKYLEEDSFFIFSKIMGEIEPFYRIHDLQPTATGYFPSSPNTGTSSSDSKNVSDLEVVSQLNMIRDTILAKADNQLHNHLLQLDIPLPLFGIRWLRLLFGREFQLLDLLVLWDAIFAEGEHLELTNFIVVAMLISIREEMIHSDYTTGLSYLMKYPSNIDVMLIIRHSLHMIAPDKYERPPNVFTIQSASGLQPFNKDLSQVNARSATLPRNMHSKVASNHNAQRSMSIGNSPDSKNSHDPGAKHKSPTSSNNSSKGDHILERVNHLQNSSAKVAIRVANQTQLNHEPGIVDGYLENSAEVLKMQLQNAHTVMTITRLKLIQYLTVFRKHIPGDSLHELHQTMDGIEELCELLKIKQNLSYSLPAPVEPAFEANEAAAVVSKQENHIPQKKQMEEPTPKLVKVPVGSLPPLQITASVPRKSNVSTAEAKREFVRTLKQENQSFEIQAKDDGFVLNSDDIILPANDSNTKARYEIPDVSLSRKAARILGNRKEVEMHEFLASKKVGHSSEAEGAASSSVAPIIDPPGERQSSPSSE